MPFNQMRTPDGAKFTHKPSGKVFTYNHFRSHCRTALRLELSKKGSTGDSERVGTATIECTYHDFLNKFIWAQSVLKYPKGAFGVAMITIDSSHRGLFLGALLMLLITFEVQANEGKHLYLIDPRTDALGFYLKLGFHPDPDDVCEHRLLFSNSHTGGLPGATSEFAEKFKAARKHTLWRGELNLVQCLLLKKVTLSFQFHQPV